MSGTDWKREYEKERFMTQLERAERIRVEKQAAEMEKQVVAMKRRAARAELDEARLSRQAAELERQAGLRNRDAPPSRTPETDRSSAGKGSGRDRPRRMQGRA